jgi:hypothetical protein
MAAHVYGGGSRDSLAARNGLFSEIGVLLNFFSA